MKKLLIMLLVLTMVMAMFAGCSKKDNASSEDEASSEIESSGDSSSNEIPRPPLAEAAANNAQKDENDIVLAQYIEPKAGDQIAVISTSMGEIRMVLYPQYAPKAVENFTNLAEDGFYNGKVFHFVEQGSLIRGGAVNSNGTGSRITFTDENGEQVFFETEPSWDLWHFRGAVSLANTQENLNGSQFVIIQADEIYGHTVEEMVEAKFPQKVIDKYESEGGTPHRDSYSTVFGMVIDGMDVVDDMASVDVDPSGVPVAPIVIESITIEMYEGGASADGSSSGEDASASESSVAA